jgi:aspartate carbamoyltransferase catalytic subunit
VRSFVALADIPVTHILHLLERAQFFFQHKDSLPPLLKNKNIALLFFEPSTRTRVSFEMAALKLGASVINLTSEHSSIVKQESLSDTLKTIQALGADGIVLRHRDDHACELHAPILSIPLMNGGSGKKEHPSQGLLDLLTLIQEFKKLEGLKIGIIGDIKHSRVASTLIQVAPLLKLELHFLAPSELLPSELKSSTWSEILNCDAVMCLRYQIERMEEIFDLKKIQADYCLTLKRAQQMKPGAIVMHPAPINHQVEIETAVVESSRSRIFKQMELGVYARMSIYEYVFNLGPKI